MGEILTMLTMGLVGAGFEDEPTENIKQIASKYP